MTTTRIPRQRLWRLLTLLFTCLFGVAWLQAQSVTTGTITGRVYNPATKEYMRNAEVRVAGTDLSAISEDGGAYTLANVPAGDVTLTVSYTGYETAPAKLTIAAGQTVAHDFELVSTETSPTKPGEVVKLEQFVVSGEREGNAKAIMQQRGSMNIGNVVASDVFGDVAEGNVGEFLKYMPGIDLEYVEADTRTPRLGGLDPQYTGVTMDGMKMASADAFVQYNGSDNSGGAGAGSRSFGFEQVSINSVDSIEVNWTTSADMAADSPAGTINMKMKRAFDRKGRHFTWQVNAMANSEDMTISKGYGPDDKQHYKVRPGGIFEYSDQFLNNRLGIVVGLSESNMYNQQHLTSYTFNATATPTDPRPLVITNLSFKSGPKFTERTSLTFTADYKFSRNLQVGIGGTYNYYLGTINNRTATWSGNTRANTIGDGFNSFDAPVSLATSSTFLRKQGRGFTVPANFEYKRGSLLIEGKFGFSQSISDYSEALGKGVARDTPAGNPTGVTMHAQRSGGADSDWTLIQTGGQDWGNLDNYRASSTGYPRVTDEGRFAKEQTYEGRLDVRQSFAWRLPTSVKIGTNLREDYHQYENRTPWYTWNYIGPGGGLGGSWSGYPSPMPFMMGDGVNFVSLSGLPPAFVNRSSVSDIFNSHPEYFVPNGSVTNYRDAFVNNHKYTKEQVNAAYAMADTRIKQLQLRAGLRWEQTRTESKEFNPRSKAEVIAAGYTVDSGGLANTIPGIGYQYFSKPIVARSGDYARFFPSASGKYSFTRNLQLQVGWSRTISRPAFNDIAGIWVFNDTAQTVRVPNPNLGPETSDKYNIRLAYYFEPVGTLAISVHENKIKNLAQQQDFSAADFGYGDDPLYSTYDFISKANTGGTKEFKGMDIEYRQQLPFLPAALGRTSVFANYSRNYSDVRRAGMVPHTISGGIDYKLRRFNMRINAKWTDVTPYSGTVGRFRRQRTMVDLNGSYSLGRGLSLFMQARNVFDVPDYIYDIDQARINKVEYYGALWTFGIKGNF
jgi:iron complex outermembrane recepter protein